jgi:hypothetical protein
LARFAWLSQKSRTQHTGQRPPPSSRPVARQTSRKMRGLVNRYELTGLSAAGPATGSAAGSSAAPAHITSIPGNPAKKVTNGKERAIDKVSGLLSLMISFSQSTFVMQFGLNFIVNRYNTGK